MFFFFFFFESEVKYIIESELTGSDTILSEYRSGDYVFDLFLPEGCRRLGFPPKTAIELKTKLVSDSVAQVTRMARTSLKSGYARHFVLIYEDEDSTKTRKEIKQLDNVRILSMQELRNATGVTVGQELLQHNDRDTSIVPIPQYQDSLLQEAKGRFHQGDVSLFLGSGVGRSAGLPDWNGLIERMVEEVNRKNPDSEKYYYAVLEADTRHSPIVMARYLKNALGKNSEDFVPLIKRMLYKNPPGKSKLVDAVTKMAVDPDVRRVITYNYEFPRFCWRQVQRVACLYTGDCQCNIDDWRTKSYTKVWNNVGTIQLPNHGSIESFDFSKNQIDRRYRFVVSCGDNNTYGHPSGIVLEYLTLNDSCYRIVSESKDSIYMQVIEG